MRDEYVVVVVVAVWYVWCVCLWTAGQYHIFSFLHYFCLHTSLTHTHSLGRFRAMRISIAWYFSQKLFVTELLCIIIVSHLFSALSSISGVCASARAFGRHRQSISVESPIDRSSSVLNITLSISTMGNFNSEMPTNYSAAHHNRDVSLLSHFTFSWTCVRVWITNCLPLEQDKVHHMYLIVLKRRERKCVDENESKNETKSFRLFRFLRGPRVACVFTSHLGSIHFFTIHRHHKTRPRMTQCANGDQLRERRWSLCVWWTMLCAYGKP